MASEGLHEPSDRLDEATVDRHRAIVSLREELEAVDWYDQRVHATEDAELAGVLAHNRDEEKEHASMTLEWLRRRDPVLDRHLRTYLFTSGPVTDLEPVVGDAATTPDPVNQHAGRVEAPSARRSPAPQGPSASLGIGSLRGHE